MPKLTKLTIASAALIMAVPSAVFAQDTMPETVPAAEVVDIFTAADVDADGALDRDEFISFVMMKSDAGDIDYKSIKISGDYDNHFNTKDYNADGLLTEEELKSSVKTHSNDMEKPDMEAPIDEPG